MLSKIKGNYLQYLLNFIIAILFIVNIALFFLLNSSQLEKVHKYAHSILTELEYKTQSRINAVKYFNTSAEILLHEKKDINYANKLRYVNDKGYYSLEHIFEKNTDKSDYVNVTGFGGIKDDFSFLNEIETTIRLSPILKEIKENNKDFAWVYYTSERDFMTLYPFKKFDEVHYQEQYRNEPLIDYARPKNNPDKKLFFTPLYVDAGGLGLMVTLGMPLYQNDVFLGATEIDLTLTSLSSTLKSLDLLDKTSFIINKENQILGANNIKNIDLNSKIIDAKTLFDLELLNHPDTDENDIDKLNSDYIFVSHFKNAPWKFIYFVSVWDIYLKSFAYTLPIWIFIFLLFKIKRLTFDLEKSKKQIEKAHKETKDGISFASLIQGSLIASNGDFSKHYPDSFVIWEPKDIVGGDIYFYEELQNEDESLLMVIDCTGHGVAGGFLTMLVKAISRQIITKIKKNNAPVETAKILNSFNKIIKELMKQNDKNSLSNAGFDGQILYYNKKEKIIKCSCARNDIYYIQNGELHIIKADRQSIGYKDSDPNYIFTEHTIDVSIPTSLYLFSDGYVDQLGGEKNFSFGKSRLKKLIDTIKDESMDTQKEKLIKTLCDYRKDNERVDDITFIGLKV